MPGPNEIANRLSELEALVWIFRNLGGGASFQGPRGATGQVGPTGAVGPTGQQGSTGSTGSAGPTGPAGQTGSVGNVTLLGDTIGSGPAVGMTTQSIQLQSFKGPLSAPENGSWAVTGWWIDPVGGSDLNSGTSSGAPLKTKAELVRRWGTTRPVLTSVVTITYLNSDTNLNDPGVFEPMLLGGSLVHTAALPAASLTGTLATVTPKSHAGNQALQVTFSVATGAAAAGLKLVNTTRGNSVAFIQRNVSGGAWQITQPLAPLTPITGLTQTPVNTWAPGDTIVGYALVSVALARLSTTLLESNASFSNNHYTYNINIPSLSGGQENLSIGGDQLLAMETSIQCSTFAGVAFPSFFNCFLNNEILIWGSSIADFEAGGIGPDGFFVCEGYQVELDNDFIVFSIAGTNVVSGQLFSTTNGFFIDTGTTLTLNDGGDINGSAAGCCYGPGTLNSCSVCQFTGLPATTLPIAHMQLCGTATGYSVASSGGISTVHGPIALSGANLAAAAGPTGFGGTAANLAGASFTNGTQN